MDGILSGQPAYRGFSKNKVLQDGDRMPEPILPRFLPPGRREISSLGIATGVYPTLTIQGE